MSTNSHLFLKSGFPKAPLQNAVGRYVCQLQRITLKFCKSHGSSKGVRDFLENNLLDFATNNPGVAVYVKPRRHRMPVAVAEYLSGDRHWICLRDSNQEGVTKWLNLLLTQNGNSSALRLRRMSHTEIPSIQGAWTPYAHANPALNTTTFPAEELSKPVDIEKSATDILLEYFAEQKQQQQLEQQSSQLEEKTAA